MESELSAGYRGVNDTRVTLQAGVPAIETQNIVKRYGSMTALNDISLTINQGVTGLLGPNGAGKSTLIKVLLGLVKVNEGSGNVLGLEIGKQGRLIRENTGYMPEDDCYIAGMTGVEVVRFSASLAGFPDVEGLRRAHEILDYCGMGQERYREIETYSTGMRQKIKFAQAIVHDPPLLIFDEPTSGLDPEARDAMLARIRNLSVKHGKTVIISTHILPDVQSCCDDVLIVAKGQLKLADKLEKLSRPSSPTVKLELTRIEDENRSRFVSALRAADFVVDDSDPWSILIISERGSLDPRVWQLANENEVAIRTVLPAMNSLEEIFVNAVRESQTGGLETS